MRSQLGGIGDRARHKEQGQAALEFAFVVPFIFILLFFTVEGVTVFSDWMTIENASRAGARCGAVNDTTAQITACTWKNTCKDQTNFNNCLLNAGSSISVSYPQGQSTGNPVVVQISYPYTFQTPFSAMFNKLLGGGLPAITLKAQTQMRLEEQSQ